MKKKKRRLYESYKWSPVVVEDASSKGVFKKLLTKERNTLKWLHLTKKQ